jgi:heme-degrading monooxygenase HmoA
MDIFAISLSNSSPIGSRKELKRCGAWLRRSFMEANMFIAMNRFKIIKTETAEFEGRWFSRESHLHEMQGFVAFNLLRGPEREDHILYASHTVWASQDDFIAWTKSEQFRAAHRGAGEGKPLYLGHPEFEGFQSVQTVENPSATRAAE